MKTLTPLLRERLKKPLGTLVIGPPEVAVKKLKEMVSREKPVKTVAVGDVVSENLHRAHVEVDLYITDNRVVREEVGELALKVSRVLRVVNRPGTITREAAEAVEGALKGEEPTRIMVVGEEDLLALPAILAAPENSFVVYGQPGEGIVVVRTTPEKKGEIKGIVEAMPEVRSRCT